MFRERLRADIRARVKGKLPYQLSENVAAPIPTYAGDDVLEIPLKDGADDEALLLEVSRRVAESLENGDGSRGVERDELVVEAMKAIEKERF